MTIREIRGYPDCFYGNTLPAYKESGGVVYEAAHESLLRSFQIVQKVKELLEKETPPSVVLEIINEMERP